TNTNPPGGAPDQEDNNQNSTPVSTQPSPGGFIAAPPGSTAPSEGIVTVVHSVWGCTYIGGDQYQRLEVAVTYENDVPVSAETVSGPYTGIWQPGCPAGEPSSQGDGGRDGDRSSSGSSSRHNNNGGGTTG